MSALGIGLPLLWAAWVLLRWPVTIEVGPETTRLTEPVTDDGYVDYLELAHNEYWAAGGITREQSDWVRLYRNETDAPAGLVLYRDGVEEERANAIVADSDSTLTADEIRWRLQSTPWTAEEFPHAAAAVQANEKWYDAVADAWQPVDVLGFDIPLPRDRNLGYVMLPGTEADRTFSRRLQHRACFRIASGDHEGAFRDLNLLWRIVTRSGQFLMQWNAHHLMETSTSRVMIMALLSCDSLTPDVLRLVEELPVDDAAEELIRGLDEWDRFVQLDLIQKTHRNRQLEDWSVILGTYQQEYLTWPLQRIVCNRIDYNAWMRAFNETRDQQVRLMRTQSWRDSRDGLVEMKQGAEMNAALERLQQAGLTGPWPGTEDVIPLDFEANLIVTTWNRIPRRVLRRRVMQIVARLALWKQQHGAYPDTLEPILSLPEFPRIVEQLTIDPYSGQPLLYRKTDNGFELRSVGDNGREEAGGLVELESLQLTTEEGMPDDMIWRWPVDDWNIPQRP